MKRITKTTVIEKDPQGNIIKHTETIVEEETKHDSPFFDKYVKQPFINPYGSGSTPPYYGPGITCSYVTGVID